MNASSRTLASALLAASLGLAAAAVQAQEGTAPDQPTMGNMQHEGMQHMKGMKGMHSMKDVQGRHSMPATVTSVDKSTGIVEVTAEGMSLRVHFPPASLANVSNGDKITLHLGFSKAE